MPVLSLSKGRRFTGVGAYGTNILRYIALKGGVVLAGAARP